MALSLNKILHDYQSGFRKNQTKVPCLKGFDDGLLTTMILIDQQKAFDVINYDILLGKLSLIGFSDDTIKWFRYYVSNRKFRESLQSLV